MLFAGRDRQILSARNPRLATLRRLSGRRSDRAQAGRFVIDGPRLATEALDAGIVIDEVFVPDDAGNDHSVVSLIARLDALAVPVVLVTREAFDRAASTTSPQPVLAIATPPGTDAELLISTAHSLLVLVDLADPGNVGTLVRVAEAAGIDGVLACGDSVEWWNPKVVRASAGSLFRVAVATAGDAAGLLDRLTARQMRTVAAAIDAEHPYTDIDLTEPSAIVLGNEAHGLAPDLAARASTRVTIPMLGQVESLNVAMAGAVLAFELARQRRS